MSWLLLGGLGAISLYGLLKAPQLKLVPPSPTPVAGSTPPPNDNPYLSVSWKQAASSGGTKSPTLYLFVVTKAFHDLDGGTWRYPKDYVWVSEASFSAGTFYALITPTQNAPIGSTVYGPFFPAIYNLQELGILPSGYAKHSVDPAILQTSIAPVVNQVPASVLKSK